MTFVIAIILFGGFATSASAKVLSTQTQTLKYGNYVVINNYQAANLGNAYLTTKSFFYANQYGIAFTDVTQNQQYFWPYKATSEGTKIYQKASHGPKETATTYGDFNVEYFIGAVPVTSTNWRSKSTVRVLSIDKKKKTVTVEIKREAYKR